VLSIGDRTVPVDLVRPVKLAVRWSAVLAVQDAGSDSSSLLHVSAACLGVCWPRAWTWDGFPRYKAGRFLEYGESVLDYLLEHKAVPTEILSVGLQAYRLCSQDLVTFQEVEEAGVFSSAGASPGPGTTGTSGSQATPLGSGLPD
jgi:hypothetical protein